MSLKTKQLDELFSTWKTIPDYLDKFVADGIINEEYYDKATKKILFVTKEPNNPSQTPGDFRSWWQEEIMYTFSYRIAEWSYGLLNSFPPFDEIWQSPGGKAKHALQHIALLNIKKCGGGGLSDYNCIMNHAKANKENIKRQIEIINADIIIAGLSWRDLRDEIFPNVAWQKSGYGIEIGRYHNAKVIDFYHPSSRNAPAASYSLLQNVVQSTAFKNL